MQRPTSESDQFTCGQHCQHGRHGVCYCGLHDPELICEVMIFIEKINFVQIQVILLAQFTTEENIDVTI